MRAERFVQSLKYDARPRTMGLIEQFNRGAYVSFDTMHGTESHHVNCTEYLVITLKGFQPATERPCRTGAAD